MLTKVRKNKKRFGWLAGLALVPVVGWGQVVLTHPQDMTVCLRENATFTSEGTGDQLSWLLNGTNLGDLPPSPKKRRGTA